MRCISNLFDKLNGLPVSRLGSTYAIALNDYYELAFIKDEDFQEMIKRGDAIDKPESPKESADRRILRCDIETDDAGTVWLVPEKDDSKTADDLFLYTVDDWARHSIESQLTDGAAIVSSVEITQRKETYVLLHLRRGSGVVTRNTTGGDLAYKEADGVHFIDTPVFYFSHGGFRMTLR